MLKFLKDIRTYLLLSGLCLSSAAAYYSIAGLIAIFPGAVLPITLMGGSLEFAKIVTATYLFKSGKHISKFMRIYMTIAVVILMIITSMGIFGFLSKAHSEQGAVTGDAQSKIAIYDEKLKTAKEAIESDRNQLRQMDAAVDQVMARSTTEQGADKANSIRKSQQRDRAALAKDIETNQKIIVHLNDESAPLRADLRKIEVEVGPIKYIAELIYGNDAKNHFDDAVRSVIILLVIVFDPLAVMLLISATKKTIVDENLLITEDDILNLEEM